MTIREQMTTHEARELPKLLCRFIVEIGLETSGDKPPFLTQS
jgi:hypothetical protein